MSFVEGYWKCAHCHILIDAIAFDFPESWRWQNGAWYHPCEKAGGLVRMELDTDIPPPVSIPRPAAKKSRKKSEPQPAAADLGLFGGADDA